jgi:hypothetical protein
MSPNLTCTYSPKLSVLGGNRHRGVAAHDLEAHLIHHLGNRRVDLARHDRRSRLDRWELDLVDARPRTHDHEA